MFELRPGWQTSVTSSGALLSLAVLGLPLARRLRRPWLSVTRQFAQELALVMAMLGLWQFVGGYAHTRVAGALERGRGIAALQAAWHLPREQALQRLLMQHPALVRVADTYYAYVHLNSMAIFIVWMWWRHRDVYPRMRFTVVVSTLMCFLVQIVPVAPPRLLPELGFVDTALLYGQSVYGQAGVGTANQLSAMPSVHVGWASVIAWYVWRCAPRRWRWVGLLHLVVTVLVVVGTANHWWLDGLVASGFVVLAMQADHGWRVVWARVTSWTVRSRSDRDTVRSRSDRDTVRSTSDRDDVKLTESIS